MEITLTRQAIVVEAIRLADAGGLEKVSMRRIADALGTGVMSLYRHVPDKDALLRDMATAAGAEYPYPPERLGDPDWRARVQLAAEIDMRLYIDHPWVLLAHVAPRSSAGESSVRCFDWLVEALLHLTGEVSAAAELALHVWNLGQGAGLGAVGQQLLAPGSHAEEAGFLPAISGAPVVAELPRIRELIAAPRPELDDAWALLRGGVAALCDGFAARFPANR